MRLSEAILLGSTTCKMVAGDMRSCALGCALNAVGSTEKSENKRYDEVAERWPWTKETNPYIPFTLNPLAQSIYEKFDQYVVPGHRSLEWLVDYVRSIEPDEPVQKMDETPTLQLQEVSR